MPNYKVKGRQGEELCVYLPEGKIAEVDKARGRYFTRSKFVLWALDRAIKEANSGTMRIEKEKTPLGATVASQAPNSPEDSSNTLTTQPAKEVVPNQEGLASVS
jgi:hypothetical protein